MGGRGRGEVSWFNEPAGKGEQLPRKYVGLEAGEERRGSWPLSLANGGGKLGARRNGNLLTSRRRPRIRGRAGGQGGAGTSWCQEPGAGGAVASTGNHSILQQQLREGEGEL